MKKNLKNAVLALICAFACTLPASADIDRPISVSDLPVPAQQVVQKYFSGCKVALAKLESGVLEKSYDVTFTKGDKLEFDRKGNWTEIHRGTAGVPADFIPAPVTSYLETNYPGVKVIGIERDKRETDVKLSNGIELTFDKKFRVIDIDM